jgi:hypothetical protein
MGNNPNAGGSGGQGNSGTGGAGGAGGSGGAGGTNNQGGSGNPPNNQGLGQGLVYETWIQTQDETIRGMLEGHERGLRNALESERTSRKDLEKQLRDLAGKAEKGSEAEKSLTEMADKVASSDRRADFYEEAHAAGVTNLRLAYLVAEQDELIDKKGQMNFEELKKKYPELFGAQKPIPKGNAGSGTQTPPPGATMNDFIRAASGRNPSGG